jgi:hypothetical protein
MLVRKIWIFIYNDTLRAIDSVALKTANDDLGFTQNNFWAKCILQNPTDADLHYLETALPITDLAELYIIDQVSGKISKAISGDALPFLNAHSIIGERFKVNIQPKADLNYFAFKK